MRYRCVIWDWNGTLAGDLDASLKATNDILARHGKPPIDLSQYYAYMDTPISRFYEHLFDLNEVPMTLIGREFYEFYPKYFEGLHAGAETLLKKLHSAGVRQVILSSAHRENVERDTAAQGIRPYFDEILAADDLLAESKEERGRLWAIRQPFPASEMVLIGDTLHDLAAARYIGADCILCAIGHQSREDLCRAGVPVVDSLAELSAFL